MNHLLSDPFVDVIADMMAKEAAQRVPTAAEVIVRLAPWAREFQRKRSTASGAADMPSFEPPASNTPVPASPLSATPYAPLGEPGPLPLPLSPADAYRFAIPVVPPPLVAQPVHGWEWEGSSGGDSPVTTAESFLRDTLPDLPAGLEASSESEVSIRMIVAPPRRMPLWLLMSLVLTPVVLAGFVLLLLWLRDIGP